MILFPYLHEDWTIPHNGDLVEWADGKLKLPYSVRYPVFLAGESPWLLEPMRAMSDPKIRRVDFRAPAGAAKSLVGEIHIAHSIVEANGLYYYVWQTDDDAKDAMEDRILPMIEANDFLSRRLPAEKDKVRRQKIVFPGLSFYCIAAKASKANSKRVRTLIMEEPHLYGREELQNPNALDRLNLGRRIRPGFLRRLMRGVASPLPSLPGVPDDDRCKGSTPQRLQRGNHGC